MTRKKPSQSMVRLDPEHLERALRRLEMSKTAFADHIDGQLSRNTVIKAFAGKQIRMGTARELADALKVKSVSELSAESTAGSSSRRTVYGEWELESQMSGWISEPNGLQYRLCRMKHCFISERVGRGKQYDLQNPGTRERERIEDYLCRHAEVSERLRGDEHFTETLNVFPAADRHSWWIIDRLVEGIPLAERLEASPLPRPELAVVMKGILDGLAALHQARIIFRELTPRRVLITSDGRTLLTDFELARLLDSQRSVSTDWPASPWRAPEVSGGGAVDTRADLFSWARLLLQAATGNLPPIGQDEDALMMAGLPKAVWRITQDCLSPFPIDRPVSVSKVRSAIRRWK